MCGVTDKTFSEFLKTTQKSGTVYKTAEEAIAGYQSYLKTIGTTLDWATIKTKAFSVAAKAISSIGWMTLITGVTWVIGKGVETISNYTHELDDAREAAKDAQSTLNELNTSVSENGQWISTNASRYKELAAGIDSLGRNISLTDEEFKEYNSLANEIADMFPELVTGYTETGTAILACKNNMDLLNQSYEAQKQATQDAVFKKSEALWSGFKADTSDSNIFSNGGLSKIAELDILDDLLNGTKVANQHYLNQTELILNNAANTLHKSIL